MSTEWGLALSCAGCGFTVGLEGTPGAVEWATSAFMTRHADCAYIPEDDE